MMFPGEFWVRVALDGSDASLAPISAQEIRFLLQGFSVFLLKSGIRNSHQNTSKCWYTCITLLHSHLNRVTEKFFPLCALEFFFSSGKLHCPPLSTGDAFQDPQWTPEMSSYRTLYILFFLYIRAYDGFYKLATVRD